jgi:hypothetical protein
MTLTGILKNILLVFISVMIWHTTVSWLQFLGYSVALAGLVYYSIGWDQITALAQAAWVYAKGGYESVRGSPGSSTGEEQQGRLPAAVRRGLVMGVAVITVMVLAGAFFYTGGATEVATTATTA